MTLVGGHHGSDISGQELFTCRVGLLTAEIERKQLERSSAYCDDDTMQYTNDLSSSSYSVARNWEKEAHRTRVRTTPASRGLIVFHPRLAGSEAESTASRGSRVGRASCMCRDSPGRMICLYIFKYF